MTYDQTITLKNGKKARLRNGVAADGAAVFENFNLTHAETDYLLSYPEENSFDPEQEARFLEEKTQSPNEIEIVALVDGTVAGTAGIEAVGKKVKVRHRAGIKAEADIISLKEVIRQYHISDPDRGRPSSWTSVTCLMFWSRPRENAGYACTERITCLWG